MEPKFLYLISWSNQGYIDRGSIESLDPWNSKIELMNSTLESSDWTQMGEQIFDSFVDRVFYRIEIESMAYWEGNPRPRRSEKDDSVLIH